MWSTVCGELEVHIIIGSGHSGVACAVRLVRSGCRVLMLDGGGELEAETRGVVDGMSELPPSGWSAEQMEIVRGNVSANAKGVQVKKLFGSDYVFRVAPQELPVRSSAVGHLTPSLAVGGFSNVWGAAALPYSRKDFAGWPLSAEDFRPHYESVLSYMSVTGCSDDLEELFPLFGTNQSQLRVSRQVTRLRDSLMRRRRALRDMGLLFGAPRLAVRSGDLFDSAEDAFRRQCVYCGMCLFGCPYGHIYSTHETLARLRSFPEFQHVSGVVVDRVEESGTGVTVSGCARDTGERVAFSGDRAFLGAGVLSTSRILLRSQESYQSPVNLKVSEYFIIPILSLRNTRQVDREQLHTLSQMFLECVSPRIGRHSAHMQLYSFSEHFRLGLRESLRKIRALLPWIEPHILGRLLVIQGYLHSDVSSSIDLSLEKASTADSLVMTGKVNPHAATVISELVSLLSRALVPSGYVPVRPMLSIGLPGEGRHAGGCFPMGGSDSRSSSDLLGRPFGLRRVHVIDASCFPTIPASTITFSVMANADRIAAGVLNLDEGAGAK